MTLAKQIIINELCIIPETALDCVSGIDEKLILFIVKTNTNNCYVSDYFMLFETKTLNWKTFQ